MQIIKLEITKKSPPLGNVEMRWFMGHINKSETKEINDHKWGLITEFMLRKRLRRRRANHVSSQKQKDQRK